jgi:hypothetical protein
MQAEVQVAAAPALAPRVEPAPPRFRPIKWWAALGGANVALAIYVLARWLTSGDLYRTPPGADPIPDYARWAVHVWDVITPIIAVITVYVWAIRPWRREGRLTFDGILVIALPICYFQDPLLNYYQYNFSYNSYAVNFGGWLGAFPGTLLPNAHLHPEPLLAIGPTYIWAVLLPVVLCCSLMKQCKRRWPQMGNLSLLTIVFVFFFVFDLVLEPLLFIRLSQLWAYTGSIHGVTLFPGSRYQFPLWEPLFYAAWVTLITALRFFRDDRGHTILDRGIDDIRASAGQKTTLRVLAMTGCVAAISFVTYYGPWGLLVGPHVNVWAKDVPSYLTNGICGPGTPYPCPAPDVPIFRPDSKPPILPPSSE